MSPPWLTRALRELGTVEARGAADNPRIVAYHAATEERPAGTPDAVPWCASFACYCLERGGRRSPRTKSARSFLPWGTTLEAPELGAIAVLARASNPTLGHVGFFLAGDDQLVWLIGGNQSDAVTVAPFDRKRVLGYRMPIDA